ncbi:MAG: hypothetical protein IJ679_02890 [Lachnospiraceae bacterium]|nr:hypothetical protein [Lachnospiraceae bacterium]
MQDIIHQYGKSILLLALTAGILSILFGGQTTLYERIAEHLAFSAPIVSNAAAAASETLFLEAPLKVCPKTTLQKNTTYHIQQLVTESQGSSEQIKGGKALQVMRLYDAPSGKQELLDMTDECILSTGNTIRFPSRGLYYLTVSLRDSTARDALQYLYISIEGDLEP